MANESLQSTTEKSRVTPLERLAPRERLALAIRAAQPMLYVVSYEEDRVLATVKQVLGGLERKRRLYDWSLAAGLINVESQRRDDSVITVEAGPDRVLQSGPVSLLQRIGGIDEPAAFLLRDFHQFVDQSYMFRTVVVRMLRDLVQPVRLRGQIVIIVSPVFPSLPAELEKDVEVIDLGLPQADVIGSTLQALSEEYGGVDGVDAAVTSEEKETLVRAALGMTVAEAELAYGKSLVHARAFNPGLVKSQKEQVVKKTQAVEFISSGLDMSSVGGFDLLKQWLDQRRESYTEDASRKGVVPPKGILLLGVPGSGKSLVAKAISAVWDYPLVRLDVGALFGSLLGQSEANMRRALSAAEAVAPCVLWIDEVEKAFGGQGGDRDGGAARRLFGSFLTWMQEKRAPVFVVATANSVEQLPQEFLRKGRFDEIFFMDLPSPEERKQIWTIQLATQRTEQQEQEFRIHAEDYNVDRLVAASDGFSGAEIEQAVVAAINAAYADGRRTPNMADLSTTVAQVVPLSRTRKEDIEQIRQWAKSRARPASSKQAEVEDYGRPSLEI